MQRSLLFAAIAASCLALGGCAEFRAVLGLTVPAKSGLVAGNAFDGLEATATLYLRQPPCTAANRPVCRDPAAVAIIVPAVHSGRDARDGIEKLIDANPNGDIPVASFDTLQTAILALQKAFADYSVAPAPAK